MAQRRRCVPFLLSLAGVFAGCRSMATPQPEAVADGNWAIAIHGGAGTLDRTASPEQLAEYRAALGAALDDGVLRLQRGESALAVCEAIVTRLEDDPHFNAGKGAAFDEKGGHQLDASIMDGSTLACGAVAGVRTVRHPIELARLVMTKTRHILLAGDGAEEFATAMKVERVPNEWFDTEPRRRMLEEVLRERRAKAAAGGGALGGAAASGAAAYGTVGCVVRDREGKLAAATSTGGLTGKQYGRVGDTPLVGAGNYADRFAAVSCTGTGEEFMRHAIGRTVSARIEFGGQGLDAAVHAIVFGTLQRDVGGLIAVDRHGNLAALYNTEGMYRGVADSHGRREVAIFEN